MFYKIITTIIIAQTSFFIDYQPYFLVKNKPEPEDLVKQIGTPLGFNITNKRERSTGQTTSLMYNTPHLHPQQLPLLLPRGVQQLSILCMIHKLPLTNVDPTVQLRQLCRALIIIYTSQLLYCLTAQNCYRPSWEMYWVEQYRARDVSEAYSKAVHYLRSTSVS